MCTKGDVNTNRLVKTIEESSIISEHQRFKRPRVIIILRKCRFKTIMGDVIMKVLNDQG